MPYLISDDKQFVASSHNSGLKQSGLKHSRLKQGRLERRQGIQYDKAHDHANDEDSDTKQEG